MNRTKRIETILEKYFGDTNILVINNSSLHKGHNNFDGSGETHILIQFNKSSELFITEMFVSLKYFSKIVSILFVRFIILNYI